MFTNYLKYITFIITGLFIIISCSDLQPVEKEKTKDQEQLLTESEENLRNKLEETTSLLKEVVTEPVVMKEIEFAVRYNTDELNRDERLDFKELLSKNSPYKNALSRQKAQKNISNSFAEKFRKKVRTLRKAKTSFKSQKDWENFLEDKNLTVYWPYSEYWDENVETPTLTFDPLDNQHRNEGFQPSNSNSKSSDGENISSWDSVMVDDQYAQENPTLIVKPNYIDPCHT
jgi:hypothetical protein